MSNLHQKFFTGIIAGGEFFIVAMCKDRVAGKFSPNFCGRPQIARITLMFFILF
jgi:hypothetical protein